MMTSGNENRQQRAVVMGIGYVGLANGLVLSERCEVTMVDPLAWKVARVNAGQSPLMEAEFVSWFEQARTSAGRRLHAVPMDHAADALREAGCVLVAASADFEAASGQFDAGAVESAVRLACAHAPVEALVVIRSTVPVGYTEALCARLVASGMARERVERVVVAPEFLRQGHALVDVRQPSRLVVGGGRVVAAQATQWLLADEEQRANVPVLLTSSREAEAIKLFANSYLAMRVAFFNELDTYAEGTGLDVRTVIEGVGLDPRIGLHYNNPSFGYGGYCLPKDTKLLQAHGEASDAMRVRGDYHLLPAIVMANEARRGVLLERIVARLRERTGAFGSGLEGCVGVYRLGMKKDSPDIRGAAVRELMWALQERGVRLIVYEPLVEGTHVDGVPVERDLALFKQQADLIIANRYAGELDDVRHNVYTRDVFGAN